MSSSDANAPPPFNQGPDLNASPANQGPYINASIWTLHSLATVFLGLRIYCKLSRRRALWWDDYLLVLSWITLLVSAICTSTNVSLGFGEHFGLIPKENLETLGILSLCSGFFSILSSNISKTSFAATLLRLSDGWLKVLIWFIVVSINILMPVSATFLWVSCDPPEKIWKPYLPGTCWDPNVTVQSGIAMASYAAACDFLLAFLPWKILLRFKMYRREKIGVAVAMSMGVFAGATAIVKCVMLPLLGNPDFTYVGAPFVVWGFAECAVLIMAASIPTMRVLFSEISGHPRARHLPSLLNRITPLGSRKPNDSDHTATTAPPENPPNDSQSARSITRPDTHDSAGPSNEEVDFPDLPPGTRLQEDSDPEGHELQTV